MIESKAYLSAASFWSPGSVSPSAWLAHAPFASWLVDTLKPRLVVDTGSSGGDAGETFRQIIARFAPDARLLLAEMASSPGSGALDRSAHTEAVTLLHLDGDRRGGSVRQELERWQPHLARDTVVLIHGIEDDPEAAAVFGELESRHPTFRLPHRRGFGIVAAGESVPAALEAFFAKTRDSGDAIRAVYAALGDTLPSRLPLVASAETFRQPALEPEALRMLTTRLTALEPLLFDIRDRIEGRDASVPDPSESHGEADRLKAQLGEARKSARAAHGYARAARQALRARQDDLRRQSIDLDKDATAARAEVERLAEAIGPLAEAEHAADVERHRAREALNLLLDHERRALAPPGGLRDALVLGRVRRFRGRARTYARLVARVEEAATAIETAERAYALARALRVEAELLAYQAEPRASELAAASAALGGELIAVAEVISSLPAYAVEDGVTGDYGHWVELYDTLTSDDRRAIRARLTRLADRPLISVIMPVYNTPLPFLRAAVASVQAQLYDRWELCIADDASPDAELVAELAALAAADARIKLVRRSENGHIAAASNSALALATGEFVALLDHDDLLAERALFEIAVALNTDPTLDLIYSDEDHIDRHGTRNTPYFKPDYSPELMLGHNLVNHLGVYRRSLVEAVGGFRLGFEGSQDHDLALRVIDASRPERIHHIPAVLYHWRSASGEATYSEAFLERCLQAARRSIGDHLARHGQAGRVVPHPVVPTWHRVIRDLPAAPPLVSIIVPTKNGAEILGPCVAGLLERTTYPNIELIIVDHQSTEPETLELLARLADDPRVRILPYVGTFNYSAINNAAVAEARGSVLALLNNDVDVIAPDWLDEMVALALLPGVGAVGAKLLYPDDRVQHAGVVLGPGGVAGHLCHLLGRDDPGYFGRAVLTSTVSAVTAACVVVRTEVFRAVGGFDAANLPVAFNDVDLCLKLLEAGYRNVWTPHALLYHHESVSRGSDEAPERVARFQREIQFMMEKWGPVLKRDVFYNPNLNPASVDFTPAFPPRRDKPWRVLV